MGLIGASGVAGCGRDAPASAPPAPPQSPAVQRTPAPPAQRPPAPPRGRGARVIVDISQSLRGFTSRSSVALTTLHQQVLEGSLTTIGANSPFARCVLDETLRCGAAPQPADSFRLPGTYSGHDAALHLVLRHPPRSPRPDLQEPDPLDPYALTVIVTDGFQSASGGGTTASPEVACAAGPDSACIGSLLAARVRQGYGVWLGRLFLPFEGRYYPERRIDEAAWERVQRHVDEINAAPEWNGVRFRARHPRFDSPDGAFDWEGARPLLVYVLSRDAALARRYVAEVQRRLGVERITVRRDAAVDVAFSELAPFDGVSARIDPASVRRVRGGGAADSVIVDAAQRSPVGDHVVTTVHCPIEGAAQVALAGMVSHGVVSPPRFARVQLGWRVAGPMAGITAPAGAIRETPGPFQAIMNVDCQHVRQGSATGTFVVYAQWSPDRAALAREWFVAGSAETSFEAPEKVYDLVRVAMPPIEVATSRRGALDALDVTLERR